MCVCVLNIYHLWSILLFFFLHFTYLIKCSFIHNSIRFFLFVCCVTLRWPQHFVNLYFCLKYLPFFSNRKNNLTTGSNEWLNEKLSGYQMVLARGFFSIDLSSKVFDWKQFFFFCFVDVYQIIDPKKMLCYCQSYENENQTLFNEMVFSIFVFASIFSTHHFIEIMKWIFI